MKNDNKAESTIKNYTKLFKYLDKHADLNNSEEVKHHIATKAVCKSYKRNLIIAYTAYCKYYKIKWEKPTYRQESKQIRIPTKEKLAKLISNASRH